MINTLKTYGWGRGLFQGPDGFCTLGAAEHVQRNAEHYLLGQALARVRSVIQARSDRTNVLVSIAQWNDHYAQGFDEVIDVLESAKALPGP
jgi:hypothetical protein